MDIGLGAGIVKEPAHLTDDLLACPASFVVWGSITALHREGNPEPNYYQDDETGASYNAIGLKNPGAAAAASMVKEMSAKAEEVGKKLRASFAPTGPGSLRAALTHLAIMPYRTLIDRSEFNAACPNHREGEKLHDVLACDPVALRELLEETRGFYLEPGQKALKIAPDTSEDMLRRTVDLCQEFEIGSIVSGNTRKMRTPVVDDTPTISVEYCGLGGAPLLAANLKQIELLARIREERGAKLILTACGGASTGEHARQYQDAGADELEIVTGYLRFGGRVFQDAYLGL